MDGIVVEAYSSLEQGKLLNHPQIKRISELLLANNYYPLFKLPAVELSSTTYFASSVGVGERFSDFAKIM